MYAKSLKIPFVEAKVPVTSLGQLCAPFKFERSMFWKLESPAEKLQQGLIEFTAGRPSPAQEQATNLVAALLDQLIIRLKPQVRRGEFSPS